VMVEQSVWHLNFRTGEAREITAAENARMAMELAKRCTFKDGVCYVDCQPPLDSEPPQ
jgi:hypothetical protein